MPRRFSLAVILWYLAALARTAGATDLKGAVATAIADHPAVHGAVAGVEAAAADIDVERAGYLPSIDFRAASGHEYVNSPSTRVRTTRHEDGGSSGVATLHKEGQMTARQMLFDGFQVSSMVAAAHEKHTSADHQSTDIKEQVALRAVLGYLSVLRDRHILGFADENVRVHRQVFDDLVEKARRGGGSAADADQARSRLGLAKSQVNQYRGSLREAHSRYVEAVGSAPAELDMPVLPEELIPSMEEALKRATEDSPAISAASHTVVARREEKEATRATNYPTVDFEATQTRKADTAGLKGDNMETSALVVMRYNLYRGGGDIARTRRALEQESQAIAHRDELRRTIERQVRTDYSNLLVAKENLALLDDRVVLSEAVAAAYRQQFDIGRRSLLDLLNTQAELFQARISQVTGQFAYLEAMARVLTSVGILVPSIERTASAADGRFSGPTMPKPEPSMIRLSKQTPRPSMVPLAPDHSLNEQSSGLER